MRVLVIDDDRPLTQMLADFLGSEGIDVVAVHEGREGLQRARSESWDAVILDLMLPGLSGFDVLRELRRSHALPVLMLSARGEDTDRIVGLELGADDYLPKPFNPRELAARLRAIRRRSQPGTAAGLVVLGGLRMDTQRRQVHLDGQLLPLTDAEYAILEALSQSHGGLKSRDELAEHALGRRLAPFDRSIDTHVSRLRVKLAAAGGGPQIQSVRGRGYRLLVAG